MNAARFAVAAALVVVLSILYGCGPLFNLQAPPGEPSFDPAGGTYNEQIWVSVRSLEGYVYATDDPSLDILQFAPIDQDDWIFVGEDLTLRAYVIDDRGLRSAISEAAYVISNQDAAAPSISSSGIFQNNVTYFNYDIQWEVWPGDPSVGAASNPSDDVTDWYDLEFTVYPSPKDDIDTVANAVLNGTLLRDWHSENTTGGVGFVNYTASRAGERRYINIFVRDGAGNVSAYGTVLLASKPGPPDIYIGRLAALTDEVWLNPFDSNPNPVFTNGPAPALSAVAETYAVALADMNDDGFDDLIASYEIAGTVYLGWFEALGNGAFLDSPDRVIDGADIASDIEIADMDGDGSLDIVVAYTTTNLKVYDSKLDLLFSVAVSSTDTVSVGDINADGFPDIVTGDTAGGEKVRVWINTSGTGVTEAVQSWTLADDVINPTEVVLADLDRDGDADLLVAGISTPAQIYYSDGDTVLTPEAEFWTDQPYRIEIADWDRNGWPDVIFALDSSVTPFADTRIFPSNGVNTFSPPISVPSLGRVPLDVKVADFNGDGWPDFVQTFVGNPTNMFQVWLNDGAGGVITGFAAAAGGDGVLAIGRPR